MEMLRPDDRHEALIAEIRERLVKIGVPARCFDADAYVKEFYTISNIAKRLRLFRGVPDDSMLEKVFAIGVRDNRFPSAAALTPAVFYRFVNYLRSPAGQTEMKDLAIQEKVARKRRRLEAGSRVAELELPIRTAEAEKRQRVIEAEPVPVGDPDSITVDLVPEACDELSGVVRPHEAP